VREGVGGEKRSPSLSLRETAVTKQSLSEDETLLRNKTCSVPGSAWDGSDCAALPQYPCPGRAWAREKFVVTTLVVTLPRPRLKSRLQTPPVSCCPLSALRYGVLAITRCWAFQTASYGCCPMPQVIPLRSNCSKGSVSHAPRNRVGVLLAGLTLESTKGCTLLRGE
jgi:hypothetical protein